MPWRPVKEDSARDGCRARNPYGNKKTEKAAKAAAKVEAKPAATPAS